MLPLWPGMCVSVYLFLKNTGNSGRNPVHFLFRCLPSCPTLVSLNISGNPQVTSAGLQNILTHLKEASRPLTLLNLEGTDTVVEERHFFYCRKCDRNVNKVAGNSRACNPDCGCWWAVCVTGCHVSGPWDTGALDGLAELVQDLRLCSQALNKLDRQALKQSWNGSTHNVIDQNSKWLLSAAALSWGGEFWLTTHWGVRCFHTFQNVSISCTSLIMMS